LPVDLDLLEVNFDLHGGRYDTVWLGKATGRGGRHGTDQQKSKKTLHFSRRKYNSSAMPTF
jgi:hypothetical protein